MKFFAFTLFFLFFQPCLLKAETSWFLSEKESSHKWMALPYYRRSKTLGHIAGGRVFVYPLKDQGLYFSLSAEGGAKTFTREGIKTYGLKSHLIYRVQKSEWRMKADWEFSSDPYYKQNSSDYLDIPVQKKYITAEYSKKLHKRLQPGFFIEFQERTEELSESCSLIRGNKKIEKLTGSCQGFSPKDLGASAGLFLRSDTRDNIFNPSEGYLFQTFVKGAYEFQSQPWIFQIESKARWIFSILEAERWIFSLSGGWSWSQKEIPYIFQFKLGGLDTLRGYLRGRFHSGEYYLMQAEFHYPVFKWLKPLFFTDLGNVSWKKTPYASIGTGFRVLFPPNYEKQIRIEFGWGKDQNNIVVAFAHPY